MKPSSKTEDRPLKTLERVLSKAGLGSRAEARKWIGAGRVRAAELTWERTAEATVAAYREVSGR